MEPFSGCGTLPRTWIPSLGDQALSGHGVVPKETESILGKLSLQIFPAAQQLWARASFPEAGSGLCCAGRGMQDRWGWDWGCGGWYPELMQVESGVSPMKYLLALCCRFFFLRETVWGGEGKRDLETINRGDGAQVA